MKQGFKACVCAVVLCAELFAAGALSAYAAQEQPPPRRRTSGSSRCRTAA